MSNINELCDTCGKPPALCRCDFDKPPAEPITFCSHCGEASDSAHRPSCPLRKKEPADAEKCPVCGVVGMQCECAKTLRLPKHLRGGAGNSPTKPVRGTSSRKSICVSVYETRRGKPWNWLLERDFVLDEEYVPIFVEAMRNIVTLHTERGDSDE